MGALLIVPYANCLVSTRMKNWINPRMTSAERAAGPPPPCAPRREQLKPCTSTVRPVLTFISLSWHVPNSSVRAQTSDVDFLFGLDMLKRHLCVIDLKTGSLALGSAGAVVPFLSEKDLPSSARETKVIRFFLFVC